MDPIGAIKPAKDTTLGLLLAAQKRGWELYYAEQKDLWLRDGIALISSRESDSGLFTMPSTVRRKPAKFDIMCWK